MSNGEIEQLKAHLTELEEQVKLLVKTEIRLRRSQTELINSKKTIEEYSRTLEQQVKRRTHELAKINKSLLLEITVRRSAEQKLQTALEELETANTVLRSMSLSDELTGLYNRRGFFTAGEHQFGLARRNNTQFLIIFLDVDGLKNINDGFGHDEGDLALIKAAEILKATFRTSDIIARVGGDEFIVMVVDTSLDMSGEIIRRLPEITDQYNRELGKQYNISFSMGIAEYDRAKQNKLDDLISVADKKLYEHKNNKRNNLKDI